MDKDNAQSEDDALEPQDDLFTPAIDEDKLAEDHDEPASPADDIQSNAPIDEPSTDDGIDSDELYQEGLSGATNADDEAIYPNDEPKPLQDED